MFDIILTKAGALTRLPPCTHLNVCTTCSYGYRGAPSTPSPRPSAPQRRALAVKLTMDCVVPMSEHLTCHHRNTRGCLIKSTTYTRVHSVSSGALWGHTEPSPSPDTVALPEDGTCPYCALYSCCQRRANTVVCRPVNGVLRLSPARLSKAIFGTEARGQMDEFPAMPVGSQPSVSAPCGGPRQATGPL